MANDYQNPAFKKLLKKLQEESWQLELLISGFAILGLFSAYDYLEAGAYHAKADDIWYSQIIYVVALMSCYILIFNLIFHVLLRGLWIGALGLRYVSGDIEYDQLNYSQKFTKYLKKRVGSFDRYIATLENYCSVIFAVSFLLIFYVIAITLFIALLALIGIYIFGNDQLPIWVKASLGTPLVLFILFGGLLTFIDFLTQGFLKRKKWISKLYFPFYWVFSLFTLSFLYRPIVYNFLDNRFGRRLSLLLFPVFSLVLFLTSFEMNYSNYFDKRTSSSAIVGNSKNYEDEIGENDYEIDRVLIESKVIQKDYLKVFIQLTESLEDAVFKFNPELEPENDIRGNRSQISFSDGYGDRKRRDSLRTAYMKTIQKIISIKVDTLEINTEFVVARGLKDRLGIETYIGTKTFSEGKHLLSVNRKRHNKADSLSWNIAKIPFWVFKNQRETVYSNNFE